MSTVYIYAKDCTSDRGWCVSRPTMFEVPVAILQKLLDLKTDGDEDHLDAEWDALEEQYDYDNEILQALGTMLWDDYLDNLKKFLGNQHDEGFGVFGDDMYIAGFAWDKKQAKLNYHECIIELEEGGYDE